MLPQYSSMGTRFGGRLAAFSGTKGGCDAEDAQWIAAARRGDVQAFEALVRKYQERLCSALFLTCRSLADAQDAAQEAFLRAYLKLGTYHGDSSFYSWLFRIAVNAVISEQRRKMSPARFERWRERHEEALDTRRNAPDQRILSEERGSIVQKALASLSTEHRMILVLREIEDCEYDEIAELLDIPLGTVRSRLHRARLLLRERLIADRFLAEPSQP